MAKDDLPKGIYTKSWLELKDLIRSWGCARTAVRDACGKVLLNLWHTVVHAPAPCNDYSPQGPVTILDSNFLGSHKHNQSRCLGMQRNVVISTSWISVCDPQRRCRGDTLWLVGDRKTRVAIMIRRAHLGHLICNPDNMYNANERTIT